MFGVLFIALLPFVAVAIVLLLALSEGRRTQWPFQMGRVISNAFAAIGTAPVAIIGTSLLAMGVPNLLLGLLAPDSSQYLPWSMGLARGSANVLCWAVVGQLGQLFVISIALAGLAGEGYDTRGIFARSLRQLPAAIVVAILTTIGVVAGLVVLVVPGIVVATLWMLAVPVIAAENTGPIAALSRSVQLSAGARWRMLLLLMIAGAGWLLASIVTAVLTSAVQQVAGEIGGLLVNALIDSLTGVLAPMGLAALYHEVRIGKEGVAGRELDAVFA